MTEGWAIAIAGFVVTISLALLGLGVKVLWDISRTFREFVTRSECGTEMSKHCTEIATLREGFEENKSAITQMILAFKQLHNVEIKYKG